MVCSRMFSKHIVWLCHKKPMSASEIAEKLNVPTVYVEEELEILRKGENGTYGLLRRMENGKYAINFILMDQETIEKANTLYTEQLPKICEMISKYIDIYCFICTHQEHQRWTSGVCVVAAGADSGMVLSGARNDLPGLYSAGFFLPRTIFPYFLGIFYFYADSSSICFAKTRL